ncbi:putative N-acyl-L-homoserine lactone synthetase [Desulforapulum autotrophicum HRM2]|uniref:N-acyl-L-homoserine lactone synthetase n=1 Tax=Desulforapulum autotrophicum (strain ATCC 43914 / DSM 3382 / VKM B-1955 / HRM2) TaxID=177437 RepID=C0QCP0_DESAH|nr:hypothetical protein [Desulforapulum autotrophicum]ACN15117.1 putative N-acyl-L-homoserine lactone synthetase [Desulforapulum autotrophicum HRM2]
MVTQYFRKLKRNALRLLPSPIRRQLIRQIIPPVRLNLDNTIFRCADSFDDYIKAFRLVHDVYVQAGYMDPQPSALRITPYHGNPLSRVFLGMYKVKSREVPIYTVSMFPDCEEQGLPMDQAFRRELDCLRSQGRMMVEIGALASDPDHRQNNMNIPMLGNRMVQKYAFDYLNAHDMVITVHPKYRWVYSDLLLFEEIGRVDQYGYVRNNPAVAMRLDLTTVEERYRKVYGHMPREKNLHRFFFEKESSSIVLPKTTSIFNKDLVRSLLNDSLVYESMTCRVRQENRKGNIPVQVQRALF